MKSLTLMLALCAVVPVSVAGADTQSTIANPAIDMQGYLRISSAAAAHRDSRRISETEFLRYMRSVQ